VAKDPGDEITLKLITVESTDGEDKLFKQLEFLGKVKDAASTAGIKFQVSFDPSVHDRSIITDTGWKIILGRGLDFYQYVASDAFDLAARIPSMRQVKAFSVTYLRA